MKGKIEKWIEGIKYSLDEMAKTLNRFFSELHDDYKNSNDWLTKAKSIMYGALLLVYLFCVSIAFIIILPIGFVNAMIKG